MFVDSHCHLAQKDYKDDVEAVIARAKAAGVGLVLCTTGEISEVEEVLRLCTKHRELKPVLGITPHEANRISREQVEEVYDLIEKNHRKLAGIGEIGLEYHYVKDEKQRAVQMKLFKEQLELAKTLDLPAIMHTRKAEQICIDVANESKIERKVLHCFLVSELATPAAKQGFVVSLPTLKSKDREKIMKNTPLESLICETDSPFLWQTGRNEPANVVEVYERISRAKQIALEKVEEKVLETVQTTFNL